MPASFPPLPATAAGPERHVLLRPGHRDPALPPVGEHVVPHDVLEAIVHVEALAAQVVADVGNLVAAAVQLHAAGTEVGQPVAAQQVVLTSVAEVDGVAADVLDRAVDDRAPVRVRVLQRRTDVGRRLWRRRELDVAGSRGSSRCPNGARDPGALDQSACRNASPFERTERTDRARTNAGLTGTVAVKPSSRSSGNGTYRNLPDARSWYHSAETSPNASRTFSR
jgi:hypothetical protein